MATEWSHSSVLDYRATLARLAVDHPDLGLKDFEGGRGTELLEDFLHRRYRDRSPQTRKKVRAQLGSFFRWAWNLDLIEHNPAERLSRPRKAQPNRRRAHSLERIQAIIEAQPELRDRVALALLARHGLRKDELRRLRWRDLDLQVGLMRLHAKGGKRPEVPIVFADLLADLNRLYLESQAKPSHYLLFPRRVGNLPSHGGRGVVAEYPDKPMVPSTMHRWFKRCLEQAGAADMLMHELRHSAGTEFQRANHDLKLTQVFMRHESIRTTADYYLHPDQAELVAGLEAVGERWAPK
jgi:integrase